MIEIFDENNGRRTTIIKESNPKMTADNAFWRIVETKVKYSGSATEHGQMIKAFRQAEMRQKDVYLKWPSVVIGIGVAVGTIVFVRVRFDWICLMLQAISFV